MTSHETSAARDSNAIASPPKALVFDVFGTLVDWRTSVSREVDALAKQKGVVVDGATFADAWRAGYAPSMHACAAASCRGRNWSPGPTQCRA